MRSAILVLLGLVSAACEGGYAHPQKLPPDIEIIDVRWPIGVQCLRKLSNGVDDTVTTTTRGSDGKANWVPGCTQGQESGTWRCPAPPRGWWGPNGAQGIVLCNITPCNGVDPRKVSWVTYPNGPMVTPKQAPTSLPQIHMPGDGSNPTPAGGGDDCLFDKNGWQFASPQ